MIGNVNDTLPISNPTKAVDSIHKGYPVWLQMNKLLYTKQSTREKTAENFGCIACLTELIIMTLPEYKCIPIDHFVKQLLHWQN